MLAVYPFGTGSLYTASYALSASYAASASTIPYVYTASAAGVVLYPQAGPSGKGVCLITGAEYVKLQVSSSFNYVEVFNFPTASNIVPTPTPTPTATPTPTPTATPTPTPTATPTPTLISSSWTNTQVFDPVGPGLTLTRRHWGTLYNSELELKADFSYPLISPSGTLWNSIHTDPVNYGWGDFSNVTTRTYDNFNESLNRNVGNNAVSTDLVMHDTINNKYYKFDITLWGSGSQGAPYAYNRQEINTTTNSLSGSVVYISRSVSLPATMSFEITFPSYDPVFT